MHSFVEATFPPEQNIVPWHSHLEVITDSTQPLKKSKLCAFLVKRKDELGEHTKAVKNSSIHVARQKRLKPYSKYRALLGPTTLGSNTDY